LELLVPSLDDHAPPAPVQVLVHLEADLRVRAHHRHLLADERVRIQAVAVVGVDHGHDVGDPVSVAADPAYDLLMEEGVDLLAVELEDPSAHADAVRRPGRRRGTAASSSESTLRRAG